MTDLQSSPMTLQVRHWLSKRRHASYTGARGFTRARCYLLASILLNDRSYAEIGRAPSVGVRERQQETRTDSDEGTYIADQGQVGFDRHAAAYPDGDRLPAETVPAACILRIAGS